ncbi:MAG: ribulose-phosphate 3-epimerase [Treponema sp.]|nr:ribulose-phosphate 3-epimerase [Treponema sp.]
MAEEVRLLDEAGADVFHCDVMDGCFVPNMAMGIEDIKCIRRNTKKPIDAHLMIENPSDKIKWFIDAGCDIIYIHPESERYVVRTLAQIREAGCKAGLAINPDTGIEKIEEMLHMCDYLLAMTVNPGFAGQKFLEFVTAKIIKLVTLKPKFGFKLFIDGACSPQKIQELSKQGVDGFVLGTSALFGKKGSYAHVLESLYKGAAL